MFLVSLWDFRGRKGIDITLIGQETNLYNVRIKILFDWAQGLFTEQIMPHCKMIKMEG